MKIAIVSSLYEPNAHGGALDYVADHTPRDTDTRYLEAVVTTWHDADAPKTVVLRSKDRDGG